jgi:hypothetical protein
MTPKLKKIIIGAVAGIVCIIGFAYLSGGDTASTSMVQGNGKTDDVNGREVAAMLTKFKSINIDLTFFGSNLFQSLHDFSVEVQPEEIGRLNPDNPFKPLDKDAKMEALKAEEAQNRKTQ